MEHSTRCEMWDEGLGFRIEALLGLGFRGVRVFRV